MSILLDAVNRKKQQHGEAVDLLSLPPIQYSSRALKNSQLNKYTLLVAAIVFGIGAAWGMSVLLHTPGATQVMSPTQTESERVASPAETTSAVTVAVTPVAAEASANDDIRLAGKVALPIAKPFNHLDSQAETASRNNAFVEPVVNPNAYSNEVDVAVQYSDPDMSAVEAESVQRQVANEQEEAIILGANANRRGLAELEALRLQVNAAAKDVDFASVKQPSTDERNNLIAAFETALKEVEFEQSANQPVTEEKLDTIPRPDNQQLPRYGDLPASVQLQVPEFNIVAHVYSTEPSNRWLNVDGVELQQGDMIKNKLTIIEIRPRDIVLDINGEQFRVPAI